MTETDIGKRGRDGKDNGVSESQERERERERGVEDNEKTPL